MKKIIIFSLLAVFVLGGIAMADAVDTVKNLRNPVGLQCSQIPQVLDSQLGFKTVATQWFADRFNGLTRVILKISAKKETHYPEALTLSYAWKPEYVWNVDANNKITPGNHLAQRWMEGRI
jgi:hypothetical protein